MLNDAVCFLLMSLVKQYVLILILHVGKCFMIYYPLCTPTQVNKFRMVSYRIYLIKPQTSNKCPAPLMCPLCIGR